MADVGIVMPVYKQDPALLGAAIHSVRNQTRKEFRLVIVVDGAPEMEPLVRAGTQGDKRVEIVVCPVNGGVSKALNIGFDILFKDPSVLYLTWVSSDNVYHPRFVEVLRRELAKGPPELGLVYSSFRNIDDHGNILSSEAELAALRQYQAQPEEKLLESCIVGVSFMYKTLYARIIGGYGMEPVEDYDFWLRLTDHCRIRHIPVELVDYRVNSEHSISASLQTPAEHRRWRHAFHQTRLQARTRRGIKPELTVLFPLATALEEEKTALESLYEQTYSNYRCHVIDLSHNGQPASVLSLLSHPTTRFEFLPGVGVTPAIHHALQEVATPYVMVLGQDAFTMPHDVDALFEYIRANRNPDAISFYFPMGTRNAVPRLVAGPSTVKPNIFLELFHTDRLRQLIGGIIAAGG
ncbi:MULTISPECIES: glycosyltransferase [unclassified Paenibacillus]|uniref:glycosyltransferase family 2 protein n=1 Tax=unclassified Paenibacillus TaxID=185978 RepID=UPI000953F5CF|nr:MULTISPECIES: glycosyltransferase [unclassified Paenibacillus]ASS67829.1 glycosyltransferase [Paenibacillus sp. RUD330]SIR59834.1 Glycosyltransferase, GT2 family [Paenibacillus sp. RU4X]SIR68640.1 Glycosyltransferase, GT2 family [Paenibacillus sp. RU4T]